MPIVSKPDRFSSCAIIPGRTADPEGFVTEHRDLEGLHGPITLYFSVTGLRQLADRYPRVGLVRAEQLGAAEEALDNALAEAARLKDYIAELERFKESVAGLTRHEYQIRKPMGRPKEKV